MRTEPRPLPETLPDLGDLPPLLARLHMTRGVRCAEELGKDLARLIPFQRLKGIGEGVALLVEASEGGQRILIVGDFDAGGATASSVGVLVLRTLGAVQVDYPVPNRFKYGYGLTPKITGVALERHSNLLVMVDNDTSGVDDVQATKAAGPKVLVTDHHLPGPELPTADAIISSNQSGCESLSKAMAGVGVTFYVMLVLRTRLRELDQSTRCGLKEPNLAELLDLVALGSVADVVPLDVNNRTLVHQGLARIHAGRARPGLRMLLEVIGRSSVRTTSINLGFIPGPRLNVVDRFDDMSLSIECPLCDDEASAHDMVVQPGQLNQDRRAIEQGMQHGALTQLKELSLERLPFGLYLLDAN